ncbi:MAG: hypothetical protein GF381_04585 [Candidatus Pacebacteria bacterium]|nr:hypothetical protein [Candidatus Paceibacterota bacterium]
MKKISLESVLLGLSLMIGGLVFSLLIALSVLVWQLGIKYDRFLTGAGLTHDQFVRKMTVLPYSQKFEPDEQVNFLLLGVDSLESRPGSPALTDTIMLFSLDLETDQILSLPLPRDLWTEAYQTKINALYVYGQEKYPDRPEKFSEEVIEQMTGVPIDYTLVVSLDQLAGLIDLVGGIKVEVKQGFSDDQFPRPDVDVTQVTNPQLLYQTITFEAGEQLMSGERSLQYIRSRKSTDKQEGNDLARGERQQQVIQALANRLTDPWLYWRQPETAGQLFRFYLDNFEHQLPLGDLLNLGEQLLPDIKQLTYSSSILSVYPDDELGAITHPPVKTNRYQGQWVYEPTDPTLFKDQVLRSLEIRE